MRGRALCVLVLVVGIALATLGSSVGGSVSAQAASPATTVVRYDTFSSDAAGGYTLADYRAKWSNPYGLLDLAVGPGDTRQFDNKSFYIDDAPFRTSNDFSVYDHLKYIAISNESFPVPAIGSVTFTSDITAETPGAAVNGGTVHGTYGPPFSYPNGAPYSAHVLQGQQAGAVMNMVDFATGQLFDWFVAGNTAFALIERLPSSVTGNTTDVNSPDWVGPDKMYTQIVKEFPVKPGVAQRVAIRYTRTTDDAVVEYFLNGKTVATVHNVGVPLDRQGVKYTGTYPSLGPGEPLREKINSFSIGHGTFSLIDAFPFQWGWNFGLAGPYCDPGLASFAWSATSASRSRRASVRSVRACARTSIRSSSRRRPRARGMSGEGGVRDDASLASRRCGLTAGRTQALGHGRRMILIAPSCFF
jgi:hypothetical protein